jgi:hypothetical protein
MLYGNGVKSMTRSIYAPNPGSLINGKIKILAAKWGTPKK